MRPSTKAWFLALGCLLTLQGVANAAPGEVRVFAMQYHLHASHVETYDSFYRKMKELVAEIAPHFATDRPNLVVFNESTGLITLATGQRFAATRALQSDPDASNPLYGLTEPNGVPAGAAAALGSLAVGYAKEIGLYATLFPNASPTRLLFLAATDTMVRSFYNAFERLARDFSAAQYGKCDPGTDCSVYVVAGADIAPFEEVSFVEDSQAQLFVDPEVLVFGDPVRDKEGVLAPFGNVNSAYVATAPDVYNTVFVFGPAGEVGRTYKVNLTPLEGPLLLNLSHGSIDQVQPITIPGSDVHLGIGISLDAFQYGDPPCAATNDCTPADVCVEHAPVQPDPLSHAITSETYMRCLDARGATLFLQPEANSTRWGDDSDTLSSDQGPQWQPLTWMASDYRAVSDPTVGFRYAVVPFMVGNLIDIVFDGQSVIYERGRTVGLAPVLHRVGLHAAEPGDDPAFVGYAGDKPETVALAPWIDSSGAASFEASTSRDELRATTARLAPGSGDPIENAYLETALCADLNLEVGGTAGPCPGFEPPLRPGGTRN